MDLEIIVCQGLCQEIYIAFTSQFFACFFLYVSQEHPYHNCFDDFFPFSVLHWYIHNRAFAE